MFPGERGGYLDIHHFRPFQRRPAQKAAGIDPLRPRDAIRLLDALNPPDFDPWTLVDARWTPKQKDAVGPDNTTTSGTRAKSAIRITEF